MSSVQAAAAWGGGLGLCHSTKWLMMAIWPARVGTMNEPEAPSLDTTFRALAHPTRRAMLLLLAERERTVSELAEPFEVSLAAASKHVEVLEKAQLIQRSVRGRTHTLRLELERLAPATEWVRKCRDVRSQYSRRLDAALEQLAASRGEAIREAAMREARKHRGP